MAHHSRLAGFIIDCQTDDLGAASSFWSRALGLPVVSPDDGGVGLYDRLKDAAGGDRKSTRLNSSHGYQSRMPSSA